MELMSWFELLKAVRNTTPNVSGGIGSGTYQGRLNKLTTLFSKGKIDLDEYIKRKEKLNADFNIGD